MNGPQHYREAESRLRMAWEDGRPPENQAHLVAEAHVHATLALAAATALNDHNGGSPIPEYRAWLEILSASHNDEPFRAHTDDVTGNRVYTDQAGRTVAEADQAGYLDQPATPTPRSPLVTENDQISQQQLAAILHSGAFHDAPAISLAEVNEIIANICGHEPNDTDTSRRAPLCIKPTGHEHGIQGRDADPWHNDGNGRIWAADEPAAAGEGWLADLQRGNHVAYKHARPKRPKQRNKR
jgi:hypothetical protein